MITSKNGRFKSKINSILDNRNYEYEFNFNNIMIKQYNQINKKDDLTLFLMNY